MEKNFTNPSTFGSGLIGEGAVAEEAARVKRLEEMLGPEGLAAIGLSYAQRLREAILDKKGVVPTLELHRENKLPPLRGL